MGAAGGDASGGDASSGLRPGRRLGRYRLCARLAGGGMGAVYLARVEGPVGFDKLLALKIIHAHLAEDDTFVRMFLDEARIASRITHPNVCSVFDFGVEDGTYFIAMEYLVGETVSHILKTVTRSAQGPPSLELAGHWCAIAAQAAEGLHAAHELRGGDGEPLGVVHRDVSPSNLFVGYDGHVQVMDFGIARAAGRLHVTQAGAIKGKLAYMAPEQLRRLEPDRRVDVWALGVVLWETLTLQRLFRRDSEMETMASVAHDPIVPPSSLVPGLPERLDEIVLRALARDRDERYPTARALARDLNRVLTTLPEPVGVSDLADWMEDAFAEQRNERLALVARARRMGEGALPEAAEREGDDVSSSVRLHDLDSLPTQVTPGAGVPLESDEREAPADGAEPTAAAGMVVGAGGATRVDVSLAAVDADAARRHRRRSIVAGAAGATVAVIVGVVLAVSLAEGGAEEPGTDGVVATASAGGGTPQGAPADEPVGEPADPRPQGEREQAAQRERDEHARDEAAQRERDEHARDEAAQRERDEHARAQAAGRARTASAQQRARRRETAEPEPPTARPPRENGVAIVIATGGWADVYTGGRRVGRTPARVTLPAGRHVLELRPSGTGSPVRRTVTVPGGGEARLAVPLGPR